MERKISLISLWFYLFLFIFNVFPPFLIAYYILEIEKDFLLLFFSFLLEDLFISTLIILIGYSRSTEERIEYCFNTPQGLSIVKVWEEASRCKTCPSFVSIPLRACQLSKNLMQKFIIPFGRIVSIPLRACQLSK